jgi:RNA polymerase sigma-70 factor (ECF subfamily)
MTAVKRIRKFDPLQGRFQSWLRGIAKNTLRNHRRRAQRIRAFKRLLRWSLEREGQVLQGSEPGGDLELAEQVTLALTGLPSRYQAVIRAKYKENLAVAEIAAEWGESPKAIESLLSRARSAFREAYRHWMGTPPPGEKESREDPHGTSKA